MATFKNSADESGKQANAGYVLRFYHLISDSEVSFKGFVTAFSDQYQSNWEKEEIYGRMDPIQTFKSTQRTINLSWDIVAGSLAEAKENLDNLTKLFNMLYPAYDGKAGGTSGMSHSPLLRMKYLNFVTKPGASAKSSAKEGGLLGSSSGFNFEPDMADAMFGDGDGNLYPKVVKLSCTFSVIHENPLGFSGTSKRTPGFPYGSSGSGVAATGTGTNNTASESVAASETVFEESRNQSREDAIMSLPDGTVA